MRLVASLLLFCSFPGLSQSGRSPALIAPDQPVSLRKPVVSAPSALRKDPVPRLNNSAIRLSEGDKNGSALTVFDRIGQARPSDTVSYNRAVVLIKLKRVDEAATVLAKLPSFAHAQLNLGILQCRAGNCETGLKTLLSAPATGHWVAEKAINTALAHYQLGQYEAAAQALNAAPASPTTQLLRGDLALAQGQYAGALAAYKGLLDDETYGRAMPVRMGNALLGLRQFAEAARQFEAYLENGDRTARPGLARLGLAQLGLANALYGQHEYGKAMAEYRAAVQLMPTSAAARTGLANAFASQHDYRNARTHYEAALKQQPAILNRTGQLAALGMGVVAYQQGNIAEANGYLESITSQLDSANPDHADAFLHQGLLALGQSRYDTARQSLETATRLRPGDPAAFSGLSEVFRRQELYGQALDKLQQAITKTAAHGWPGASPTPVLSSKTRARMLANQGSLLLKLNRLDQAYPVFKAALTNDPGNINALNGRAVSLLETDHLDEANSLYDSLISRGNHRAFLHNNRGIVRAYTAMQLDKQNRPEQARQRYQQAKTDFEKAQQLDTTRQFYQNNLGNVLKTLEQYDEAVKCYQAYLSKSAINNMGVLYAANKKPDFSRYYLNLAIDLDSTNLVYHYNRVKLYRAFFADSLARKPKLLAAERQLPTNSISAKYSRDGYINIYLYDYDFDAYDYPTDHHFPIQQEPPHPPDLLPVNDFIRMPEPADLAPVARPLPVKPTAASVQHGDSPRPAVSVAPPKRARMPKPANARRVRGWGSTRCPVF